MKVDLALLTVLRQSFRNLLALDQSSGSFVLFALLSALSLSLICSIISFVIHGLLVTLILNLLSGHVWSIIVLIW